MIKTLNLFPQKIGKFIYKEDLSLYVKELYNIKKNTKNFFLKNNTQFQTSFKFFEEYKFFAPIKDYLINNLEQSFNKKLLIISGNEIKKYEKATIEKIIKDLSIDFFIVEKNFFLNNNQVFKVKNTEKS